MTEKEFIKKSAEDLKKELKKFPDDFIPPYGNKTFESKGEMLILGAEFFGNYDLINSHRETILQIPDFETAKYYIYASLPKPEKFPVPLEKKILLNAVKEYEKYLDEIMKSIKNNFLKHFPDSTNYHKAVSKVFQSLNLQRY